MSLYELIYLMSYANEQLLNQFSVFVGFSTAAIVGAYVAGKNLTNVLAWGIVLLYGATALVFISGRIVVGGDIARLQQDVLVVAQHKNVSLHMLENIDKATGYGVYMGLPIWMIIAAAVIFFVFYAKSRFPE